MGGNIQKGSKFRNTINEVGPSALLSLSIVYWERSLTSNSFSDTPVQKKQSQKLNHWEFINKKEISHQISTVERSWQQGKIFFQSQNWVYKINNH